MSDLIDLKSPAVRTGLNILLKDRATGRNIILATDAYEGLEFDTAITRQLLEEEAVEFVPRVAKSTHEQLRRTRKKAEVFTPSWICNRMNNHCDREFFGREAVFNAETEEEHGWTATEGRIEMPEGCSWRDYVLSRRLEITCGEAPYLVSRYDTATGEPIPIAKRIGILDRKLRLVGEHTRSQRSWNQWAYRAYESTYGYEYQGDSLLMARINMLETFCEYTRDRWQVEPSEASIKRIARIISWNLWQMDGLQNVVPHLGEAEKPEEDRLLCLFEPEDILEPMEKAVAVECRLRDWQENKPREIMWGRMQGMKFDYVIGNPPYQESQEETSDRPVYNEFLDAAYCIADKVELITPARFLFNAGKTPKNWNTKILSDEHIKVLYYEQDSSKVFSNTDIKGGVAVTYRDSKKKFGAIEYFIPNEILRNVLRKVRAFSEFKSLSLLVRATEYFKMSGELYKEHPEILKTTIVVKGKTVPLVSKGHEYDLTSNILDKNADIFWENKPNDDISYVRVYGRQNGQRVFRYFKRKYLQEVEGLRGYKVILPESNNNGTFGETLVGPFVAEPDVATTQTFITIGFFENKCEAESLLKYIKGKFARAMLNTLKITQHNKRETWKYVPLQTFTSSSDIDWSQSIPHIDQQLYRKYGLSAEEIDFIETHVKEME